MVKDAEAHAEEDRKLHELVETRNRADSLAHGVRKSLKEHGDKLDAGEKEKIEAALKDLDEVIKGDDKAAIEAKSEALATASHKLAEKLYAQQQAEGAAPGGAAAGDDSGAKAGGENVVDAEFSEVKDDKKK
jgi:molecular chaperone DnaK